MRRTSFRTLRYRAIRYSDPGSDSCVPFEIVLPMDDFGDCSFGMLALLWVVLDVTF